MDCSDARWKGWQACLQSRLAEADPQLDVQCHVVAFVVASIGWADVNASEDSMISISGVRVVEVWLSERTTLFWFLDSLLHAVATSIVSSHPKAGIWFAVVCIHRPPSQPWGCPPPISRVARWRCRSCYPQCVGAWIGIEWVPHFHPSMVSNVWVLLRTSFWVSVLLSMSQCNAHIDGPIQLAQYCQAIRLPHLLLNHPKWSPAVPGFRQSTFGMSNYHLCHAHLFAGSKCETHSAKPNLLNVHRGRSCDQHPTSPRSASHHQVAHLQCKRWSRLQQ